ncbi:MAG: hypothetical protein EA393_09115 [Bacteroidetes bacterium]|nr:MAG: hypothetical protein EA393_09115 [Bacteroidota bacterium]
MQIRAIKAIILFIFAFRVLLITETQGQALYEVKDENGILTITKQAEGLSEKKLSQLANKELLELFYRGFLKANISGIESRDNSHTITLSKGPQFFYQLSTSISPLILQNLRLERYFTGIPVSFKEFDKVTESLLRWYENNGYPFAHLRKHETAITDSIISLTLMAETMDFIVFDTLQVSGDANLNRWFLENHLGILPGQKYSEKLLQDAGMKLQDLDFVSLSSPIQLSFAPGKARIDIPLQKVRANRFDGVAGVSGTGDSDQPLQISGLLNLYLVNAFGMGEFIDLAWKGLGQGTQILDLSTAYPYLLRLPMQSGLEFSLHRQDTSWLKIRAKPALQVLISPKTTLGIFWEYMGSNLINTSQYAGITSPPQNLDFRSNLYGLQINRRSSGFRQNLLQKGYSAQVSAAAGNRNIIRNTNLPAQIYEQLDLKTLQIHLETHVKIRFSLGERSTFSLDNRLAFLNGNNNPANQLFRLGGFQSLKGFDELSIVASSYLTSTAEYRFFTGPRSYLSVFVNGGWYEQKTKGQYVNDFPIGTGTGLSLETQAGIFAIYFALGTKKDIPLEFRNAKIHIGYISTF